MSQKKVDAYKAEKANREKIMKREKLILILRSLQHLLYVLLLYAGLAILSMAR